MGKAVTKITLVTSWYNEELLAPLFLEHYSYVDEIIILLETDTNDKTASICYQYPNVKLIGIHCEDGNDDGFKTEEINKAVSSVKEGWVYVVDADEFIFPEGFVKAREFLDRQNADIVKARIFHVYRHSSDKDIDYSVAVIPQRVHGVDGKNWEDLYAKPAVCRASCGVDISFGNHKLVRKHSVSKEIYVGAHWYMADKNIALTRRLRNRKRVSVLNKKYNLGKHNYAVTKEEIEKEIEAKSNLPVIDCLVKRW